MSWWSAQGTPARGRRRLRAGGYPGPGDSGRRRAGAPYQRPPLSKEVLDDGTPTPTALSPRPNDSFDRPLDLGGSPGRRSSRRARRAVQLTGGRRLGYDHLVLATGAAPRRITCPARRWTGWPSCAPRATPRAPRVDRAGAGGWSCWAAGSSAWSSRARRASVDVECPWSRVKTGIRPCGVPRRCPRCRGAPPCRRRAHAAG